MAHDQRHHIDHQPYRFVKPVTWAGHNDNEPRPVWEEDIATLKRVVRDSPACSRVASHVSLRQSATETGEQFVRRLVLAVLDGLCP